ncbi:MAG TPA: arginine--tRNA ligase [Acidimicrobiales bacterium]|nr:arginine--tRNA ligase [Acidimicrobiales bacterium]
MRPPVAILTSRLQSAIETVLGEEFRGADPVLRRSTSPQFGDYQANAAMALGKKVRRPPRELAQAIIDALDVLDVCSSVEVAGPGFINLTLRNEALAEAAEALLQDGARFAVPTVDPSARDCVVIDYSSPTLTKEMHVGHLRSTVIGDALARTLDFAGHEVVRQNHYGEWGTQFGMLIEHLRTSGGTGGSVSIEDLNVFYQDANARFTSDESFKDLARARVVALQAGDPESLELWRQFVAAAKGHAEEVYELLDVTLRPEDERPESSFNPVLDDLCAELEAKGVARVDDGALCAFPDGFKNREGEPLALIIRKSDGGYGYQATDLAAVKHRLADLGATRVVYVVDARQTLHLRMVFAVARNAGWVADGVRIEHVAFGTVMDADGKPFKSRSGENVKLGEVLEEAVQRAGATIAEKNPDLDPEQRQAVARAVGIGAVKWADLQNDRIKDYVFDWDRMLAFEGNSGPYLQYAHARVRSIFRRGEIEDTSFLANADVVVTEDAERALVLQLLTLPEVVDAVVDTLQPHRLATYSFELAQAFTAFFEHCPVLRAPDEETRTSRLALCELTARTLQLGLGLLGIETPDRM